MYHHDISCKAPKQKLHSILCSILSASRHPTLSLRPKVALIRSKASLVLTSQVSSWQLLAVYGCLCWTQLRPRRWVDLQSYTKLWSIVSVISSHITTELILSPTGASTGHRGELSFYVIFTGYGVAPSLNSSEQHAKLNLLLFLTQDSAIWIDLALLKDTQKPRLEPFGTPLSPCLKQQLFHLQISDLVQLLRFFKGPRRIGMYWDVTSKTWEDL